MEDDLGLLGLGLALGLALPGPPGLDLGLS